MTVLQVLAFVLLAAGVVLVFGARFIVTKFNLNEKSKVDFENEMNEEEMKRYKFDKALVNVKLAGMLVALPGIVLILVVFK